MAKRKRQNRNHKNNIVFVGGLCAAVLFFLISGYVSYSRIRIVQENAAWVAHTYEVLVSIDTLLSLIKDAETGQRGYVVTGKEEYLEPYNSALLKIENQIEKIKTLTDDNPLQQERISIVRKLVGIKLSHLSEVVNARRNKGFEQASAIILTDRGKEAMDNLRETFSEMRQTELDLRQERDKKMENSYRVSIAAGVISAALGIVLSIIAAGLLYRAAEKRRQEEWFQTAQVGLSNVMLGDLSVEQLAQNILKFFAEYLNAHAGIFYARDDSAYARVTTYGFPGDGIAPEKVEADDGLLGQAIRDARAFVINDVPDGYINIGSAMGQGNPRHLIISPAFADGSVNAVFELGFVQEPDKHVLTLLSEASKAIGVAIQSAKYKAELKTLLEETQSQAEELQSQSEELRASNEELQSREEELKTQQEELEASNEEMEEKTKALEEQNTQIKQKSQEVQEAKKIIEDKAREVEQASKYKSEFLANMSHELRTPLNSLLILARSLASNEDGNLTQEQVEEAQVIHNGGLELLSLINDILDLSKVEAGKLNIVTEDVPLDRIVKKLAQQFEPISSESGVALNVEMENNLPETIRTDVQRVEQILKNLLSNAFKFTEAGSVTLRVFRPGENVNLQRDTLEHGGAIAFAVTDTGIGIEETKLGDIFEAFQQEDGSIDRHYGGTGLGLTIARKFAHMLGGEVHVSSKKGEGSTFTLMLPIAWEAQAGAVEMAAHQVPKMRSPQETDRSALKSMPKDTIRSFIKDDRDSITEKDKVLLIIEDDRDFANTLMKMARKNGYKCLAAGDGKTGVLLVSEQPVSAIILDLTLPDIDGINVLDQLKSNLRTRHIPVHIITGRDVESNVVPMRKGAIGYLTKPVTMEDIEGAFGRIETLLQSEIKKILVVEDDKKTQTAIQSLLKKKDIEIICAGKGKEALNRAVTEEFDCIILDLTLPDMTGFEWLQSIESQAGNKEPPPVIVYTARDLTEDENRKLNHYTGSIVIKGASSSERLLDEVTLFLHSVESTLTKDQQAMIRMQHDPDKVLHNRKVLLVDDDMRNTFALSKLLKKHGMEVVIADNGQMALEKLAEEKNIELVIMDIMMPIMDGYQAMHAIRAQERYSNLPIIALTARAMPEEQDRCIEAGADDYLVKPVDVERLLTLMRVWLFRHTEAA